MDKKRVELTKQQFDLAVHNHEEAQVEYWLARELMPLLGYERWENFDKAIIRAMESCETSGIEVTDHFREVTKMIEIGKGGHRPVKDYMLTRYACYLIAQNGDPKKEEIAFAQSYFALQTRKQELIIASKEFICCLMNRNRPHSRFYPLVWSFTSLFSAAA